jgi:hypothetical protein
MPSKRDTDRKTEKRDAIVKRLAEMRGNEDILFGLLDETKLDLMILALGIGGVILNDDQFE